MKNKLLIALLVILTVAALLIACTAGNDENNETETTTEKQADVTTVSDGADDTTVTNDTTAADLPGDETSAEETTAEETTAEDTEPTLDLAVNVRFDGSGSMLKKCFSSANQCKPTIEANVDGYDYALKLTTSGSAVNDPFIYFDYSRYCKLIGVSQVSADDYKYVALRIKCENLAGSEFELFHCAGKVTGATGDAVTRVIYDNSDPEWQYILFDLSRANWAGKVNGFRLDFTTSSKDAGETMYISELNFIKSDDDFYKMLGYDTDPDAHKYVESPEDKEKVDKLLAATDSSASSSYYSYVPEKAEHESSDLKLGFKDMTTRTAQNDNSAIGTPSYLIRMAKNEIEGCQAILAADETVNGVKVYITDFENADGYKLTTDLLWGYYFNVEGKNIVDPLPPVKYAEELKPGDLDYNNGKNDAGAYIPNYQKYNGFNIAEDTNQTFIIKAHTDKNTPAGEYSAVFTVKDKDGNEIKKATIYVYVWNFTLSETPACKTLADISWFALYANHKAFNGDNGVLYQKYYDYMLENGICGYDIPYNNNAFNEEKLISYLNNPRVTAFQTVGWKTDLNAGNVSNAFNFLKDHPEWLEKAYFYPIDEPNIMIEPNVLDRINNFGKLLKENFPGYKLIVPMHLDSAIGDGDYFTYVSEYVNAWCPHNYFFNTFEEYLANRKLTYRLSSRLEKNLGTFPERMAKEQAEGDEVWWYVTRFPHEEEITLTMNTNEINYRILFWQQKLYNIDGFLYYSVTDWYDSADFAPTQADFPGYDGPISGDGAPTVARPIGLNSKHETEASYPYNVYGNGVLVYIGQYFGEYGPVGCYRLECVRDGIEDFEYLTMLEEIYGKETTDLIIKRITMSLAEYTDDEEFFVQVRNAIGNLLEQELNK